MIIKQCTLKHQNSWMDNSEAIALKMTPEQEIGEIWGSIESILPENETNIKMDTINENTFFSHNGKPFDTNDLIRVLKVGDRNKEQKKGESLRGFGFRNVFWKYGRNLDINDITQKNYLDYPWFATKVQEDIEIDEVVDGDQVQLNCKKNDIILYIFFGEWRYCIYTKDTAPDDNYKKIANFIENKYNKYLHTQAGVLVNIPTNNYKKIDKPEHKLRFKFNKFDYNVFINENMITEDKPGAFLSENYEAKYSELKIDVYKHKTSYKGVVTVNNSNCGLKTDSFQIKLPSKYTKNEFIYYNHFIEEELNVFEKEPIYSCKVILSTSYTLDAQRKKAKNEWKNKINSNKEYYYGTDKAFCTTMNPYIDKHSLRFDPSALTGDNNNLKNFFKNRGIVKDRHGCRHATDKIFKYKDHQIIQADVVEEFDTDDKNSIIHKDVVKTLSEMRNSAHVKNHYSGNNKGYVTLIPVFITAFAMEHMWDREEKEEEIISEEEDNSNAIEAEKAIEERDAAIKQAEEAEKQAEEAEKQAEKEKQKAEEAKKQAEKEKQKAEEAKKQAEKEKQKAEEAKQKEEESKNQRKQAEKKTKKAEERVENVEQNNIYLKNQIINVQEQRDDIQTKLELEETKNTSFDRSARAQITKRQKNVFNCIFCESKDLPIAYGEYCHIISKKNGGTGDPENGVFACSWCNHGTNPWTLKKGMHSENMLPWLKRTYPERVDYFKEQCFIWGINLDNAS